MKDVRIVIGANFGDEGKGLMTDYFAAEAVANGQNALVVCSNGGAQRGHTVLTPDGVRHVFHHFGSGTLAGADTYLPRFFILNPMIFMNEYEELAEIAASPQVPGFRKMPKVYLSPYSPVSTPYDMITNQIVEAARGNDRHGSCGIGIWETLVRNGRNLGEMMEMSDDELSEYLIRDCTDYMLRRLAMLGVNEIPEKWREIVDDSGLAENYIADFRLMTDVCEVIDEAENAKLESDELESGELESDELVNAGLEKACQADIQELFDEYDRVIFENGQGLLLDRCRKEYGCNTTPSNTGFRNPAELIREYLHIKPRKETQNKLDIEVCYVTRTYLTRHGAGRFDEECRKEDINPDMADMTNVPNPYQGTIRYGILNEREFRKRIREDFDSEKLPEACLARITTAVTHINEFPNELAKSADYTSDGKTRDECRKI